MNAILDKILEILKEKWELFLGWLEVVLKPGFDRNYKYVLEKVEIKDQQGKLFSIIHYKLVGCRKLLSETAAELNKLTLFTLFRPDHAQIIISIATAEALMGKSDSDIFVKYKNYIEFCNQKLDRK